MGRYAPSPSGDLHLGNLRTALLAWLFARYQGGRFLLRIEDLDRVKPGAAQGQLRDLASLGLDWDGPVLYQSSRLATYHKAVAELTARGLTYPCYCTRKEIHAAGSAPHTAPGSYPGNCRNLSQQQRQQLQGQLPAAIRLKTTAASLSVKDYFQGTYRGRVDDFVLLRKDGKPAYNLAVVLDDHWQGINQVVRGHDLLSSAPRQAYLGQLLGYRPIHYAHVPLALNQQGQRLAKRDGAVTLAQLRQQGVGLPEVMRLISASIPLKPIFRSPGWHLPQTAQQMLEVFDPATISRQAWYVKADSKG